MQERGYLYVPFQEPRLNTARLLKYLGRAVSTQKALWLVDRELFYPGIGPVFGCSAERVAPLGLEHCRQSCVISLSDQPERAREKPARLCGACSARLTAGSGRP